VTGGTVRAWDFGLLAYLKRPARFPLGDFMSAERRKWVKANGPCKFCGATKDLQVDHIDRTQKETHAIWSWSKERRDVELAKCQVLCGPCNRKKYMDEMGYPTHGASGYRRGCRCEICREGQKLKMRVYRFEKKQA
jgi:5-methylcytosine-specific restriction endonuclease McrA